MNTDPMSTGNEPPAAVPASPFGQPVPGSVPVAAPMAAAGTAAMAALPTPSGGIPMPMTVAPQIPGVPVLPAQARPGISADPEWFRTAVFYEALLRSFADSDGDGIGDLRGLISRLDYLAWLGVDCVWIPPFYPSPIRDGGYDISDYTAIDPRYGTMEDFRELVHQAHQRGIRIVIDMVVNHTSDAHPWFQASRSDPEGPYGDFYVWADDDSGYDDARIIFVDTEESNWAYDVERGQFYWHRFFSHQPDLNYRNPAVIEAIHEALSLFDELACIGSRIALSDVGVAASFATAALRGASLNVLVNTSMMADRTYAERLNARTRELVSDGCERAERIFRDVEGEMTCPRS